MQFSTNKQYCSTCSLGRRQKNSQGGEEVGSNGETRPKNNTIKPPSTSSGQYTKIQGHGLSYPLLPTPCVQQELGYAAFMNLAVKPLTYATVEGQRLSGR